MDEATGDHDSHSLLRQGSSHVSNTILASPVSPFEPGRSDFRIFSVPEADTAYRGAEPESEPVSPSSPSVANVEQNTGRTSQDRGLAIENVDSLRSLSAASARVEGKGTRGTSGLDDPPSSPTTSRVGKRFNGWRSLSGVPAAIRGKLSPGTPRSVDLLLSPSSTQVGKDFGGLSSHCEEEEVDGQGGISRPGYTRSPTSLFSPFVDNSDHDKLRGMSSPPLTEPPGGRLDFECRTKQNINQSRCSWFSMTILVLAVYSTIFSGIWLSLAIRKPRYGRWMTNLSKFPPATASLVCAAIAKSIELSFVTVYVALIGQVLSRRAITKRSEGITIAEMTMRAWVMQPGTMITHWHTIQYAGPTILGVISLFAALMAMLYTTASDALVAPKLTFGKTETRLLYGKVSASWANSDFIESQCQTPIRVGTDPVEYQKTCVSIEHPGQAYHNYMAYLAEWTSTLDRGNGSDVLMRRPKPTAMMYDNTTVQGSWIHIQNMTELSAKFGSRIINNISMAMPHSGVFAAAREPKNNILQPQDLGGLGEYYIRASVPSPSVNILCASMNESELAPMIYEKWPAAKKPMDVLQWPLKYDLPGPPSWLNKTLVDDVFGFGQNYSRRHPVFPKLPMSYNTILNFSKSYSDSLYLLAASSEKNSYMLCSIRASLTPNCSTEYRARMDGGSLTSWCEDPKDDLSYHKTAPTAPNGVLEKDWITVAYNWATSINLSGGIADNNGSNSRLLTQFIPTSPRLDPVLPSIAEALAVLAGCTLLLGSNGAPFVHFYNYTVPALKTPQYESFNAIVRTQDYASGGTQRWQNIFYAVLIVVFAINVFCLIWLCIRIGFITDFTEPQNLFSIAVNSPASHSLDGSCGGGPENEQFATRWFINLDPNRAHFYIQEGEKQPARGKKKVKQRDYELTSNPVTNSYNKLATKRTSFL